MKPTDAIIAVTLNCNARCVMCDIWKNDMQEELQPEEYRRLPSSLKEINITGGEPFLRNDLPKIIEVIKETCPKARLVISTNGFIPNRIKQLMPYILKIDPYTAVRISIDGLEEIHEKIRGISGGFQKDMTSLGLLKELGVRDLGIAMTVMEENIEEVTEIYKLAENLKVEFSVTVAIDSEIYFGDGKSDLCPKDGLHMKEAFGSIIAAEYRHWHPKHLFRAWFEKGLLAYEQGHGRPIPCDAGEGFFYLNSQGQVFACHILPTLLGNLRTQSWEEIWSSKEAENVRQEIEGCEKCWMVCTARSEIRKDLMKIGIEVFTDKMKAHLGLLKL